MPTRQTPTDHSLPIPPCSPLTRHHACDNKLLRGIWALLKYSNKCWMRHIGETAPESMNGTLAQRRLTRRYPDGSRSRCTDKKPAQL
jgi:hypothetical protein